MSKLNVRKGTIGDGLTDGQMRLAVGLRSPGIYYTGVLTAWLFPCPLQGVCVALSWCVCLSSSSDGALW